MAFATCDAAGDDPADAVRALARSLARHGSSLRWQMAVADTGSCEGTVRRMREAIGGGPELVEVKYALEPSDSLDVPYHGLPGRARALRAILAEAATRRARGCIVVDPRSAALEDWIDGLVQPVIEDTADLVAPIYNRHPFTGALVHGLVYPMFRALYGARVRYPMWADFACSPRLIEAVASNPVWETGAGQIGIDLWLTATAVSEKFRVGEAALGAGPPARARLDLGTTVSQVIGFVFTDMERRAPIWQRVRGSREVRRTGVVNAQPDPPDVDAAALIESFRLGSRELQGVWAEVLPPLAILQWRRLESVPLEAFRVDDALWARTVYDFAMGHRLRVMARDSLLRSLTPLYLGWLASFVMEARHLPPAEADARIERLCLVFETEKPYLISQWRWPERFKPVKLRR